MKILVVDDSAVISAVLVDILSPFGVCQTAENGRIGFEMFKQAWQEGEPYDLICLDIVMPEMDGHETLKHIRTWEIENDVQNERKVKIIMVTSQSDPRNTFEAFKEYCDDYVTKPVEADKLLFKMRRLDLVT